MRSQCVPSAFMIEHEKNMSSVGIYMQRVTFSVLIKYPKRLHLLAEGTTQLDHNSTFIFLNTKIIVKEIN